MKEGSMVEGAPASARTGDAKFGEAPLAQTAAAAGAMRRISSVLLSLEHPHPAVDAMLAKFVEWEDELVAASPADNAPRIREIADDPRRVYLNHATDIGAYNPCFPEYRFDQLDAEIAGGVVCFPLVYEGPPGLVHGGFLGVFFDCVIQHHNCDVGVAGRTTSLLVEYHRPTPLEQELRFEVERVAGDRSRLPTVPGRGSGV